MSIPNGYVGIGESLASTLDLIGIPYVKVGHTIYVPSWVAKARGEFSSKGIYKTKKFTAYLKEIKNGIS